MFSFEINIEISESILPIDVINTTIHEIGHALTQYVKNVIYITYQNVSINVYILMSDIGHVY